MVNASISQILAEIERRGEDLEILFSAGAQPHYDDVLGAEAIERDQSPLSIVPPRDAYLATGDPVRPSFTRDGALQLRDGVLVTSDGSQVLGGDPPAALHIERADAILGRFEDARIDPDGLFSYARTAIDPQTLATTVERVDAGRVALARFPSGTRLERVDATHVRPPPGVTPAFGTPADGSFGALAVRSRAVRRIDPDAAIVRLQDAYLAARALGAAERTRNGMAKAAFDLVK
ncbi:MAG: hypothetical protein JO359_01265 [Candidatus Eremiobacteraeota bacterium]|nr:hypothetical protein [Candidatus Eremiobacteraeota bacterium]